MSYVSSASVVVFFGCLAFGCGGPRPAAAPVREIEEVIQIDSPKSAAPVDLDDSEIQTAYRQLEELMGHPISFRFDSAVSAALTDDMMLRCIKSLAQDLAELKDHDPKEFAFTASNLLAVSFVYDVTVSSDTIVFQPDEKTIVLTTATPAALRFSNLLFGADMHQFYVSALAARFAKRSPETISVDERSEYLTQLLRNSDNIPDLLRFVDVSSNLSKEHRQRIDYALLHEFEGIGQDIVVQHFEKDTTARALFDDPHYTQTAADLTRWFFKNLKRFSIDTQMYYLERLFYTHRLIVQNEDPTFAWPGVDPFEFGLDQFRAWMKTGRPDGIHDPIEPVQDFVVCPVCLTRSQNRHTRIGSRYCKDEWYSLATRTAGYRRRLTDFLKQTNDPDLTSLVFHNIGSAAPSVLIEILKAIEDTPSLWLPAWRVLYLHSFNQNRNREIFSELIRIWNERPPLRGGVLSGLVHMDYWGEELLGGWENFALKMGTPVDEAAFRDLLIEPDVDLDRISKVWPALSSGWSRADLLIPHFDRLTANQEQVYVREPIDSLRAIIDEMCRNKNRTDLKKLEQYLNAAAVPPDARRSELIKRTKQRKCSPKRNTTPPEAESPVLRIIQTEGN